MRKRDSLDNGLVLRADRSKANGDGQSGDTRLGDDRLDGGDGDEGRESSDEKK